MRKWLSESVARGRAASRRGAAPGSGDIPNEGEIMQEHETVEDVLDKKGAGRKLLCRAATLIEYSLLISVVSLVVVTAGPPVAEAIQGQFTKVANVISNGSTGGTGGGSDFPGGGSGGGGDQGGTDDKTDSDGDGIPDSQDKYPNDPNNGAGGNQGGSGGDSGNTGDDGSETKDALAGTISLGDCVVGLTSAPAPDGAVQSDASLSYTWYANGSKISTDPYYTFIPVQNGAKVYVTATDASGEYTGQIKSETVTVTARGLSEIMGVALPDPIENAQCDAIVSGAPRDAQLSYTWKLDGSKVSSSASYTPEKGDAGKTLEVTVRDTVGTYAGEVSASKTVGEAQLPKLNGYINLSDCTVGLTSSAVASGVQGDAQLELTWYVDGKNAGTGTSHDFTAADRDKNVYVTAEDKGGNYQGTITSSVVRVSARTLSGTVAMGDPVVGATLTASVNGMPSDMVPAYRWVLDGSEVGTDRAYTPKAEDAGKVLYVEVTDSSNVYTGRVSSAAATVSAKGAGSGSVEDGKLTGSIQIGTCTVGLSSSAFATGVPADAQLSYEWQVDGNKVADTQSYTFTTADKDKEVRVLATDKSGKYEGTLYSNVVRVDVRQITGSVTFGEPVANAKLTANVSGIPSDIAGSLKYVWKLDGTQVSTSSTYTPDANAVGKVLFVEVSDGSGKYSGTVCSTAETVRAKSSSESGSSSGSNQASETIVAHFRSYIDGSNYSGYVSNTLTLPTSTNVKKSSNKIQFTNAGKYRITPISVIAQGQDDSGFHVAWHMSIGNRKISLAGLKGVPSYGDNGINGGSGIAYDSFESTSYTPMTLDIAKNETISIDQSYGFISGRSGDYAEAYITVMIEKID